MTTTTNTTNTIHDGLTLTGTRLIASGGVSTSHQWRIALYGASTALLRTQEALLGGSVADIPITPVGGGVMSGVGGGGGYAISFEDTTEPSGSNAIKAASGLIYRVEALDRIETPTLLCLNFNGEVDVNDGLRFNPVDKGGVLTIRAIESVRTFVQ